MTFFRGSSVERWLKLKPQREKEKKENHPSAIEETTYAHCLAGTRDRDVKVADSASASSLGCSRSVLRGSPNALCGWNLGAILENNWWIIIFILVFHAILLHEIGDSLMIRLSQQVCMSEPVRNRFFSKYKCWSFSSMVIHSKIEWFL